MGAREIIKIAVTPEAKQAIEAVCQWYGMSQIELASRLYTWLAEQDEVIQAAILGILPDAVAPDVARLVLQRIATGSSERISAELRQAAKKAGKTVHVSRSAPQPPKPKR